MVRVVLRVGDSEVGADARTVKKTRSRQVSKLGAIMVAKVSKLGADFTQTQPTKSSNSPTELAP